MAQGTGQARRQQAGKEKASKRSSAASTRKASSARGSAKASSNGRSSTRSTKASSNGGSGARSTKASSGARSTKTSGSSSKRKTASASSRQKAGSRRAPMKPNSLERVTKPIARTVTKPIGHALKGAQDSAVKAARGSALEIAGASAKVAQSGAKQLRRAVRAARPAAGPLGATGAAVAIAGLSARALARGQIRSRPRIPKPRMPDLVLGRRRRSQRKLPTVQVHLGRAELLSMAAVGVGLRAAPIARRVRRLPIQRSIDVAVPLGVAYDEWMKLESLPEGAHNVRKIERKQSETLGGRLSGRLWPRRWEAEIRDERDAESFAWRSVKGSDCAGLITFHRIDDRLTRLELQLDVIPKRAWEAIDYALRLADLRAGAELRRFKARVEMISPDAYDSSEGDQDEDEDHDHNNKEG